MIDPTASDWSDLDLLTTTEANARLTDEILVVEGQIAELENSAHGPAAAELTSLRLRLAALRARVAQ
jgi:hypothetical protein